MDSCDRLPLYIIGLVIAGVLGVTGIFVGSSQQSGARIEQLVASGVPPIAAACAVRGFATSAEAVICAAVSK